MFYPNLRNIDSKFHQIKVNHHSLRFNRIQDIFKTCSVSFTNYESPYEHRDWYFTMVVGKKCRFHDIYIITYVFCKIGLSHIYISNEDNTDIFIGEHLCYEGPKTECMHVEFVLGINPLKSWTEVIKLYQDYPYKNQMGYSKAVIDAYDQEVQDAAEDFYSKSSIMDESYHGYNSDERLIEGALEIIPPRHYSPDNIIMFGVNKGNTLKEIYHYMPKYIEWLIKYVQEFEIDVREFEVLPKPITIEPGLTVSKSRLQYREHVGFAVNAIKKYAEIKPRNTKEIEFKFTNESIEI